MYIVLLKLFLNVKCCLELNDGIVVGSSNRISEESIEPFSSLYIHVIKMSLLVKDSKFGLISQRYSEKLRNLVRNLFLELD